MIMAVQFAKTLGFSSVTALVVGALFYVLSAGKSAALAAYTVNDTYLGTVFVLLLALIIGLAVWPRVLEENKIRSKK
jgi:lipopolysaccharide export LptBFGC system permease protein LptF